jgi:hypothetical protein
VRRADTTLVNGRRDAHFVVVSREAAGASRRTVVAIIAAGEHRATGGGVDAAAIVVAVAIGGVADVGWRLGVVASPSEHMAAIRGVVVLVLLHGVLPLMLLHVLVLGGGWMSLFLLVGSGMLLVGLRVLSLVVVLVLWQLRCRFAVNYYCYRGWVESYD